MLIKNIIFDLGGVLLTIDYEAPIREFKKLGIQNFNELYTKASQSSLFDAFETGKITPQEFRQQIRNKSKQELTDKQIDLAWNSILLDFPIQNKDLLTELAQNYRLFLLSNTNNIHIISFEQNLVKQFGSNFFNNVFEKVYYSSQIGCRKPAAEAFYHVLENNALSANETVFIDDSEQHVAGALKLGIKAHWLNLANNTTLNLVKNQLCL